MERDIELAVLGLAFCTGHSFGAQVRCGHAMTAHREPQGLRSDSAGTIQYPERGIQASGSKQRGENPCLAFDRLVPIPEQKVVMGCERIVKVEYCFSHFARCYFNWCGRG